jgi:hypothetical protein
LFPDPAADVGEILQNIIGNQSVSSSQKMKHLHNFVKVWNENSMISPGIITNDPLSLDQGYHLEWGFFYPSSYAG